MADMRDDTDALLVAMAAHGLRPNHIIWDGKVHRFRGPNDRRGEKDAWYVAYPDPPRGAAYGYWPTGLSETWYAGGTKPSEEDIAAWKKREKERQEAQERRWDEVAAECEERWKLAEAPNPNHPYLISKGITPPFISLKQLENDLIIPVKGCVPGNPIWSMQFIFPDGSKRFAAGGRVRGGRTTLSPPGFTDTSIIYVAEGYATAWSVMTATQRPTVVAFMAHNLLPVVEYLRLRYPSSEIIIAADNDRFSECTLGPNPGYQYAMQAAKAHNAIVRMPSFPEEDTESTDFNDLHRLYGLEAVMKCLAGQTWSPSDILPKKKTKKRGPPPKEQPKPVEDVLPEWLENAPFRILGHNRGSYFFMSRTTGQIRELAASSMERKANMFTLAPMSWWQAHFQATNGVAWPVAVDTLIQYAHKMGIFEPSRVRGRGCWLEFDEETGKKGYVLHLGDRMIVPGENKFVDPQVYVSPSYSTYERQAALQGPSRTVMTVEEANSILRLFCDLLWTEKAAGYMLAGWTALAPICGALEWRPHVWLVGERGCGKTTVIQKLVLPLLADMALSALGKTTEAGIRHALKSDALPVVFDEAEEDNEASNRIQGVIQLARAASSETDAETLKGTSFGGTINYKIRSMFLLASIGGAILQENDATRIALLTLRGPSLTTPEERAQHWADFQPRLLEINRHTGRNLIARMMRLLRTGMLDETTTVFRTVAAKLMKEQRLGDQFGTLYAGSWCLHSDEPPTKEQALGWMSHNDLDKYIEESMPDGLRILQILLQQRERVETSDGVITMAIGQLLEPCMGQVSIVSEQNADRTLRQLGLRVIHRDGTWWIAVANQSEWVRNALKHTMYGKGFKNILRSLPGASQDNPVISFHAGLISRSVLIPISTLNLLKQDEI